MQTLKLSTCFKKALFTSIIALFCYYHAAAQQVVFSYDAAGNQISRSWICVNCTQVLAAPSADQIAVLDNSTLVKDEEKTSTFRSLTTYPNPVTETLNLEWKADKGVFIKSVEVFSMGGLKVFQDSYSPQQTQSVITFGNIPAGGYILRALYSDGKKEIVKIIKQ